MKGDCRELQDVRKMAKMNELTIDIVFIIFLFLHNVNPDPLGNQTLPSKRALSK
jgi:hypothetical protein